MEKLGLGSFKPDVYPKAFTTKDSRGRVARYPDLHLKAGEPVVFKDAAEELS
jgi:hypothetical protein